MGEWVRTNDGRPLKTTDALLDALHAAITERDEARRDLATERVSHRMTKKELADVIEMRLPAHV